MKENQLKEGVFCSLKMGRWDAIIKMPSKHFGKRIPREIVRARQDIISDRTYLKDLSTIRRSAKGLLLRNSLPFPIDNVFWIPKEKIVEVDKKLNEFREEYKNRVKILCDNIKEMESNFQEQYPEFYDKKNYPSIPGIKNKFYFFWNFLHFAAPSKEAKTLSPALYKREQEKFTQMISKMEEMTINVVGNMLFKRIEKLAGQCDSGKINAGTVGSISKFLKRWDGLWKDHVDEKKLHTIMKDLQKQMRGTSAERLKGNEDFRNKLGNKLEKIIESLQKVPDFKLKRKLDI